jgi:peptidoglycan/xylan/chitin deacetylase (PgdA/CDA1 family)
VVTRLRSCGALLGATVYRKNVPIVPVVGRRGRAVFGVFICAVLLAQVIGGTSRPASAIHAASQAASQRSHRHARSRRPVSVVRALRQARFDRAVGKVLSYSPFVARGGGEKREIALTFDDGPGPYTPKVLIALNRLHVKATFFVIGQQERRFQPALLAEFRRGHVIGDHTETHAHLGSLAPADQYREMLLPSEQLTAYGLPRPLLFRPPYGSYNQATFAELKRLGMLMVLWTVDSQDYRRPGILQIAERVVSGARPGAIMLLHDGGGDRSQTVAAIPKIVKRLRAKHYHLVTLPRLLADDPPPDGRRPPKLHTEHWASNAPHR